MIPPELQATIVRLHEIEKWKVGTIANHLAIHHTTVARALVRAGVPQPQRPTRRSIAEPYIGFIKQTLEKYPRLRASRLYEMVRERGYSGRPDHFRHIVALHRPRPPAEAFMRLRTLPGEQAQVDWGHFGTLAIGRAVRPLLAFVMVLSWCRRIFLRFFLGQHFENFVRGHQAAFEAWGGCPRVVLYDNLKSAVLERNGDAIRFNPNLLAFAAHYRYEPRPVAPYRGNEKGRVERAISYIRHSFFAARVWRDLDDLNAQATAWCEGLASQRRLPEDTTLSVTEAFEQERPKLLALPDNPYPCDERVEVKVGKTPYVRFDLNDYSVPHTHVRRTLVVHASLTDVRVLEGAEELAVHPRTYDRGQQIEDPAHVEALIERKREAREHRGMDRLAHAVPRSRELMCRLAERGHNLGSATISLLRLLDHYGAAELDEAIAETLDKDAPHHRSVRLVLERRRRERGCPPPVAVTLPDDPRVRELSVRPHDLSTYDPAQESSDDDHHTA
jgi:transposase